jgi:hypothetical protein
VHDGDLRVASRPRVKDGPAVIGRAVVDGDDLSRSRPIVCPTTEARQSSRYLPAFHTGMITETVGETAVADFPMPPSYG